ncbi:hypothetical protein [Succinivibrio dextrinosolvens]|uniref:hypothetical protein n=1 Tax=Succinivibrio dextrinosolvens TaxID=83771 RepID=UPI00135661E7|nr:hypothetical protein [Succinivibrio dextrinosolvens]
MSDINYEDILGFKGKGRPNKNAAREVIAVAVTAKRLRFPKINWNRLFRKVLIM